MKLRKYQEKCLLACSKSSKGRIVLPTGSGKSYIALEKISRLIQEKQARISVVFVPRIMLAKQWLLKAATILINDKGHNVNFINLNSGGVSRKIADKIEKCLYEQGHSVIPIESGTDPWRIKRRVNYLLYNKKCQHVVIFCTYHSWEALAEAGLFIDVVFYDECHYLVSNDDFFGCLEIPANHQYPMTATQRFTDSDDGKGMNNERMFGPVIYEKKPVELIKVGAILSPRIHIIGIDEIIEERAFNNWSDLIYHAFLKHKQRIKEDSADPEKIGAKLLIVCNGQLNLQGIFESARFRAIRRQSPELKIFGLCSDFGIEYDNKYYKAPVTAIRKEEFLAAVGEMNYNDDALIFHVDMISEGLDVPGITGVIPLRNTGIIKSLQNIGRASRLHPEDSIRIEDKELKPGDYNSYIKPFCYAILPYCMSERDDFVERNVYLLSTLRSDYGFDPSEHIIVDRLSPGQVGPKFEEDDLDRQIRGTITQTINQFYHEIDEGEWTGDQILFRYHFNTLPSEIQLQLIERLAHV